MTSILQGGLILVASGIDTRTGGFRSRARRGGNTPIPITNIHAKKTHGRMMEKMMEKMMKNTLGTGKALLLLAALVLLAASAGNMQSKVESTPKIIAGQDNGLVASGYTPSPASATVNVTITNPTNSTVKVLTSGVAGYDVRRVNCTLVGGHLYDKNTHTWKHATDIALKANNTALSAAGFASVTLGANITAINFNTQTNCTFNVTITSIYTSLMDKATPFVINEDDLWNYYADSGNGSAGNPWILDGFDIDLGSSGIGINITNCTDHALIHNTTVIDAGVYNIFVIDSENVDFDNMTLDGCAATMFYGDNITNCTITNAILYNADIGIKIDDSYDVTIENVTIDVMVTYGIEMLDTWGFDIEHVDITTIGDKGIYLDGCDGAILSALNVHDCADESLYINDSTWIVLSGSMFVNSTGIIMLDSSDITVMSIVVENSTDTGISISITDDVLLDDIEVYNHNNTGLLLLTCDDVIFSDFVIEDFNNTDLFDGTIGIDIDDCNDTLVIDGIIENATLDGVKIHDDTGSCTNVNVTYADIINCNTSILLDGDHFNVLVYEVTTYDSVNAIVLVDGASSEDIIFEDITTLTTSGYALEMADVANITFVDVTLDASTLIVLAVLIEFNHTDFVDNMSMTMTAFMLFDNCTFTSMGNITIDTIVIGIFDTCYFNLTAATGNFTSMAGVFIQRSLFRGLATFAGNLSSALINYSTNAYDIYFDVADGNAVDPSGWHEGDILPETFVPTNDTTPIYSDALFGGLVPTAHFSIANNPSKMYVGTAYTFTFDGTYGNGINTISWNFGDHTPQRSGASVAHVFTRPGTYTVKVTVVDGSGDVSTYSAAVTIVARSSGGGGGDDDDGDGDDGGGGGLNPLSTVTGETTFVTACVAFGTFIVLYAMYQKKIFAKIAGKLRVRLR